MGAERRTGSDFHGQSELFEAPNETSSDMGVGVHHVIEPSGLLPVADASPWFVPCDTIAPARPAVLNATPSNLPVSC